MKELKLLLSAGVIFLISGCETIKYVPTIVPVIILPEPTLPKMTPEQDASIPDGAYEILVKREELLKNHIKSQKEIIELHNKKSDN